jgi:hypothetical protein
MSMLPSKDEISKWCDKQRIENYTINDDLTIDVDDSVILYLVLMEELPVQFKEVSGDFILGQNGLKTLKGAPLKVGGDFICSGNFIKDLDFLPIDIDERIILLNNGLESFTSPLEHANNIIWISEPIPGLTYLDIDENEFYKYDIDEYLKWNQNVKNFFEENTYVI